MTARDDHGGAVARQQVQQIRGHAGGVEQGDRLGSNQRRLFGGLGQYPVARGQRRSNLTRENGQREVPGADADEHAAPMQAELVGLAHRAAQGFRAGKLRLGQVGVVAAEVDRLAHLRDSVGEGLASIPHADGD